MYTNFNLPDNTWDGDPLAPWNQDPYEDIDDECHTCEECRHCFACGGYYNDPSCDRFEEVS